MSEFKIGDRVRWGHLGLSGEKGTVVEAPSRVVWVSWDVKGKKTLDNPSPAIKLEVACLVKVPPEPPSLLEAAKAVLAEARVQHVPRSVWQALADAIEREKTKP